MEDGEGMRELIPIDYFDRRIAEVKDPLEMKDLSQQIEIVRRWAAENHYEIETVNELFYQRFRIDKKRGDWIQKNIRPGNPQLSSMMIIGLSDIDTSLNESSYCQRLLHIYEEDVRTLIKNLSKELKEASKAALLRYKADGKIPERPKLPKGKFAVLYADPPWKYENFNQDNSAQAQYITMDQDELISWQKEIQEITCPYSVLFMWAVNPLLPEAIELLTAWGFKYKTNWAWVKDHARGKAWWARSQHELLLIGTRSQTPTPEYVWPSIISAPWTGPSRKPIEAYERIEKMFPLGVETHIELFAREKRERWISYGNEL